VYLDRRGLADTGTRPEDIAAWLRNYTYGENIGPYTKSDAIQHTKLNRRDFSAVLPTSFIQSVAGTNLDVYGSGNYPEADVTGIPAQPPQGQFVEPSPTPSPSPG
jgi:hypothetical protein